MLHGISKEFEIFWKSQRTKNKKTAKILQLSNVLICEMDGSFNSLRLWPSPHLTGKHHNILTRHSIYSIMMENIGFTKRMNTRNQKSVASYWFIKQNSHQTIKPVDVSLEENDRNKSSHKSMFNHWKPSLEKATSLTAQRTWEQHVTAPLWSSRLVPGPGWFHTHPIPTVSHCAPEGFLSCSHTRLYFPGAHPSLAANKQLCWEYSDSLQKVYGHVLHKIPGACIFSPQIWEEE